MKIDLVRLRHLAEQAGPGKRRVSLSAGDDPPSMYFVDRMERNSAEVARFPKGHNQHFKADAQLCAALDPETLLELLDRLGRAERERDEMEITVRNLMRIHNSAGKSEGNDDTSS